MLETIFTTNRTTADDRGGNNVAVSSADDGGVSDNVMSDPDGSPEVPADLITEALPPDILKMTFKMLPVSNRFLSPVCRRFRDLCGDIHQGKKRNKTCKYSITTEDALKLYLEEALAKYIGTTTRVDIRRNAFHLRDIDTSSDYYSQTVATPFYRRETSLIGAGCGRRDWVERGGMIHEETCCAAAEGGQLSTLQWLHGRVGFGYNIGMTCTGAAKGGHLEILKWARGAGCKWDTHTCEEAASGGHLEVLQWARREGCEWNSRTCEGAAFGGHLEVLKWAREEGCEWDSRTCSWAAAGGHLELLKWAISNGCPHEDRYYNLEEHLDKIKDVEFIEWFEEYKRK